MYILVLKNKYNCVTCITKLLALVAAQLHMTVSASTYVVTTILSLGSYKLSKSVLTTMKPPN